MLGGRASRPEPTPMPTPQAAQPARNWRRRLGGLLGSILGSLLGGGRNAPAYSGPLVDRPGGPVGGPMGGPLTSTGAGALKPARRHGSGVGQQAIGEIKKTLQSDTAAAAKRRRRSGFGILGGV
jgi:hypothetical protein